MGQPLQRQDFILGNGGENIFEIGYNDGRGRFLMHWGVCYTNDKTNPHYQRNGFQGGQSCPTPTLYYAYDESDLRRDINMVPYNGTMADTH